MESQKLLAKYIKLENESKAMEPSYEPEYTEVESIDIKEEIIEGKIPSS